jgi:DNA invertase Pin-like site-specific DNA recombinase
MNEAGQKVTAAHLKRNAYLYVRQSTPRQALENSESTARQYALRQRAAALGWPQEQIVVSVRSPSGVSVLATFAR